MSTPAPPARTKGIRRFPPQIIFGVIAATVEMAVILYFMYC